MISTTNSFVITTERAIELIGQIISHYVTLSEYEYKKSNPDIASIKQWEVKVYNLKQEQKACRVLATKASMIEKVYTVYFPFLNSLIN